MLQEFPVYRKYTNNKSYFKVLAPDLFEEVQMIGSYYAVHRFEAKILPDHHFIADMLALRDGSWVAITALEYEVFVNKCAQDYKRMG